MARRPRRFHNGGPPLDDYDGPPWGKRDAYVFLAWQAAHAKAWKAPSRDVMLMRLDRAERLGLTYEEYTLEILERGRHLQEEDAERIAEIRRARKRRRFNHFECRRPRTAISPRPPPNNRYLRDTSQL